MSVPHALFVLVLLKVPEYVRDILDLPFFGSRVLYVDFYLLCAGCLLCACAPRPSTASPERAAHRARTATSVLLVIFTVLAGVMYLTHQARDEEDRFFALQLGTFLLSIYQLHMLVERWPAEQLLRHLRTGLVLVLGCQLMLHLGRAAGMGVSPDWLTRNQLAYAAIIGYVVGGYLATTRLCLHFALLAIALIAANSTKGAAVLLFLLFFMYLLDPLLRPRSTLRAITAAVLPLFVVLIPFMALQSMLMYFDATIEDLVGLEEYRYYIDDNYTSLISRSISVAQTLLNTINHGDWLGLGVDRSARMIFYGYPVHNYIVSSIAVFGVLGALLSAALLYFLYRVSKEHLALGAVGAYLLIVSNDLYAVMTLLFIPIMMRRWRRSPTVAAGREPTPGTLSK
jgi:hypothetical protein